MAGLKMFAGLPRKPGLSVQQFHDHWRHPHGTLALGIPSLNRYVQNHQSQSSLLSSDQDLYDGIAEVWFENEEDAAGMGSDPTYVRDLMPDELKFIDMARICFLFTDETILQATPDRRKTTDPGDLAWREANRSTAVKIIQLIRAADEPSFIDDQDLELGRRIGAFRHVRGSLYRPLHPDGSEFVAVRELWWPTRTVFEDGVAADKDAFDNFRQRARSSVTLLAIAERFR